MFSGLFLTSLLIYFLITQINILRGIEEIFKDAKRISGKTEEYQAGRDKASSSKTASIPWTLTYEVSSSSNSIGLDAMCSQLNRRPETKHLGEPSNSNQYYSQRSQINQPEQDEQCDFDFVDSLLQFPEDDEQEISNIATGLSTTATTELAEGPHNLIRVYGLSKNKRRHCRLHWTYFRKRKNIMTMCDTCNEMMCTDCFLKKHELESLTIEPTALQTIAEQICFYCNQTLENDPKFLIDHTKNCYKIPRISKNGSKLTYSCYAPECAFLTDDKANIRSHLRKHTGEKPYPCRICEKRFVSKRNRDSHFTKKHSQNTTQNTA